MKTVISQNIDEIIDGLNRKFGIDLDKLVVSIKKYNPELNEDKFRLAFKFAVLAHDGQMRKQKDVPYIVHPYETSKILIQIHADENTLIAALLHDVPEDTNHSLEEVEEVFGKEVSYMVEGITKLSKVHYRHDMEEREVESMKRLFIHVAEDPRIMLIKLADRLHNMRTLEYMSVREKRLRKAREALEIFAPIAGLLGIKEIQAEMEDLCFINLYPDDYQKLKKKVEENKKIYSDDLHRMINETEKVLKGNAVEAIVYSFQENLYSTYRRLKKKNSTIEDLEVTFLINVIVNDETNCFKTLGIIHSIYKPQPGKIKDYISLPKANGYQSLHTTVFGDKGINTKYCIRTNHMHFQAQYGIAASYFEGDDKTRKQIALEDSRSQWVEEAIQLHKDQSTEKKYFDQLKKVVFQDRIGVLSPKGELFELPVNATSLDFAYCIHTEVGHRAIRAVVNGNPVALDHHLRKGDVVKIITTNYQKGPSYEWLSFAKTPQARKAMKDYFRKETVSAKIITGRKMLQKEYDRAGLGLVNNLSKRKIGKVAIAFPKHNISETEDVFVNIAEGNISTVDIVNNVIPQEENDEPIKQSLQKGSKENLTKLSLSVTCSTSVNFTDLATVMQKRKNSYVLTSGYTKYNFINNKIIYKANMLVRSYNDIATICRDLENIEGVESVKREFLNKKLIFIVGSILTFIFWCVHPLLIYYITTQWNTSIDEIRVASNIALFSGLLILFSMIFYLKSFTEHSFPELRGDGNALWMVTYVLSFFALLTIIWEIQYYHINFDMAWILAMIIFIFAYLTGQYIYFKERQE